MHPDVVAEFQRIRPAEASPTERVFNNETLASFYMVKKDIKKAGITPTDDFGYTLDFHALRHTLATNLTKANVTPRVAMKMMRHSDIRQTMLTYTDESQLALEGVVLALPAILPLKKSGIPESGKGTLQRTLPADTNSQGLSQGGTEECSDSFVQAPENEAFSHELTPYGAEWREGELAALLGLESMAKQGR